MGILAHASVFELLGTLFIVSCFHHRTIATVVGGFFRLSRSSMYVENIFIFRGCSRDPSQAIANRVKEMYEVYCQSMPSEGEFSNLSKGGRHFPCPDKN